MIINGIDVDKYFKSHSGQEVATVINALQAFALHRELELYLKNGMYKRRFAFRDAQAIVSKRIDTKNQLNLERSMSIIQDRTCQECGSPLLGTKEVRCAGRVWYEECTVCTYYREEFGGR